MVIKLTIHIEYSVRISWESPFASLVRFKLAIILYVIVLSSEAMQAGNMIHYILIDIICISTVCLFSTTTPLPPFHPFRTYMHAMILQVPPTMEIHKQY